MGRLFQGAATVQSVLRPGMVEAAAAAGLRSLFVGFETLSERNLIAQGKKQNLGRDYAEAIARLHDNGVMVNGSFVFGMDDDGPDVFDRTVEWAVSHGIETATFHILTPYPGTALHDRMQATGRILHSDWDLYDTRHVVHRPARMSAEVLEAGYWDAYEKFYTWRNIARGARHKPDFEGQLRHFAYAAGWKKFEPMWDAVIRLRQISHLRPLLERILNATSNGPAPAAIDPHEDLDGSALLL